MKGIYILLFLSVLLCRGPWGLAQLPSVSPEQAKAELQKRGLTEDEVRQKLLEKGIDIDNIRPDQLPELENTLAAVLQELEQAKSQRQQQTEVSPPAKPEPLPAPKASVPDTIKPVVPPDAPERTLPLYGQQLFRDKNLQVFSVSQDARPPDSYMLGVGDELAVSIFGLSQGDFKFVINAAGFITPDRLPKIYLKGVRFAKAQELVRTRLGQFYVFKPEQFSMSLSTARNITVNIFGETANHGSFTLPALNTAFNALVAAGGPTDIGSVRKVKLIRNGEVRVLDVYAFMNNPNLAYDFYLQENDVLHVPVAERVVALEGAVKRPMRYELTPDENLIQLLEYAGGLSEQAYRPLVQVQRYANDRKVLLDVNLAELQASGRDFELQNGDAVSVRTIPRAVENYATVEGAVDLPGNYALENTPRLRDLLVISGIKAEARRDLAFLLRTSPDQSVRVIKTDPARILANPQDSSVNLALQARDKLIVYARERYTDKTTVAVSGAVRHPETFAYQAGFRISELLELAGGLSPDATDLGYIIRQEATNPNLQQYLKVNVRNALQNLASADNVLVQPNDKLQVLALSTYTDLSQVRISGAVRKPGEFRYSPTLTLLDALTLAGGLKLEAAGNRIDVYRVMLENNQPTRVLATTVEVDKNGNTIGPDFKLQPYDQVVVRQIPDFEFQKVVVLAGEVKYPGPYALIDDNEKLSHLIERAGGLTAEAFPEGATLFRNNENLGYVVTRLDEAIRNQASNFNLVMRDGDLLTVPKTKDLVTIRTSNTRAAEYYSERLVGSGKINVAFQPGKTARWYVNHYAAGLSKNARWRYVTVEQPNGRISKVRHYGLFLKYPKPQKGSVISIGAKAPKPYAPAEKKEKKPVDWEKIASQTIAQVASVLTVVLLLQQVK